MKRSNRLAFAQLKPCNPDELLARKQYSAEYNIKKYSQNNIMIRTAQKLPK